MTKEKKHTSKWPLLILALIAIVATAVYSGSQYYRFNQGIPEDRPEFGPPGPRGDRDGGGRGRGDWRAPSEEERQQRMQEMAQELNLTPDQQNQIRDIMSQPWEGGPENRGQRMQQVQSVLTPEQQEKAHTMFESRMRQRMDDHMQRRLNEAKKSLPPKEVKALEEQMKERRKQMEQRRRQGGGRRGGPPGPPGFGPPPGGGPPPDGPPPPDRR
ncbi:MAG: hypothetical protein KC964_03895 [Candidatus Omnitrophica bacterium]|nr:hypothetical protein [Candidatus Omnitrophota bacterium]